MPRRNLPIGAEFQSGSGTSFRVWAPAVESVAVELLDASGAIRATTPMTREPNGYFALVVPDCDKGTLYRYRLPHGSFPDPASRFQPDGPHGPSQVIDPAFPWSDAAWTGRPADELVLYELHVGTFTREGTWEAARRELAELARIGVTGIEVMPVADFPGRFGWGYDGVNPFAPTRLYGRPEDARRFVDTAHSLGLMVLLDVVYNHLGPDGCYLREFSRDYFTDRYHCEWGDALNFDGPHAAPVREYFLTNTRYWIEEFHFDGLRLDATQQIFDASENHIVAEITTAVRIAAGNRRTFVVGENEPQNTRLLRRRGRGGYELDAAWNDDFHHTANVAATGHAEAYYRDYRGSAQEFISAAKFGYLFQGQWSAWQQKRRGSPAFDLSSSRFVIFLQNHDQVANSLAGLRIHQVASPGLLRALTAVLLLTPPVPMLFQGQEFGASTPFQYFADHKPELARLVADGRRRFLSQFPSIADAAAVLPDCTAPETFLRCQLDLTERERHRPIYLLHQDLLRLRRDERVFRSPARLDGAVLGEHAFVLRYFAGSEGGDRLLVVNLHGDLRLNPAPEPLLAPPADAGWRVAWSSESPSYGGLGTPPIETQAGWSIPGPAAFVLAPDPHREPPRARVSEKD